jgi:hypothetical protein
MIIMELLKNMILFVKIVKIVFNCGTRELNCIQLVMKIYYV